MGQQHMPGDEAWLIDEQRMSDEKKYCLDLPARMDLRTLAATIKARWISEQAHEQLKEELGLDQSQVRGAFLLRGPRLKNDSNANLNITTAIYWS